MVKMRRRLWRVTLCLMVIVSSGAALTGLLAAQDDPAAALAKGDYKAAEAGFRHLLNASPQSPELLSNVGIALELQGKSSEAIPFFEQSLRIKQTPRIYALLAAEKCKVRDVDGARPMLEKIHREQLHNAEVLSVVAPCFLELDEPIEAVDVYKVLAESSTYPQDLALIQLASAYRRSASFFIGKLARAQDKAPYMQALTQARTAGSNDARGAFDVARRSSPYFKADLDFESAVKLWRVHPADSALLYLLGVISGEQSIRQVEVCDEKYPDSQYLAKLTADILAEQGHEAEAVAAYQALVESHPELPDLDYDLGMLYRKTRDWERAQASFQKQLERDPDDERTAARVSEALVMMGKWQELALFLEPRVKADRPPRWALLDSADAWQNLNETDKAITALTVAEKISPADAMVHYRLMRLYRQAGKIADAERELKLFRSSPR